MRVGIGRSRNEPEWSEDLLAVEPSPAVVGLRRQGYGAERAGCGEEMTPC